METALLAYLNTQTGVTALVSSRMEWEDITQGTALPYVRLTGFGDYVERLTSGDDELEVKNVQFDCFSISTTEAQSIRRAIKDAISGKRFTHGGYEFVAFLERGKTYFEKKENNGAKIYCALYEFSVWFKETA